MTGAGVKSNWWYPILITLIALIAFYFLFHVGRISKIHRYLGNNHGSDPSRWAGLVGSIEAANAFHREQYTKIGCELWLLQHPGQPRPNPCPPDGPPTTKPPSPPAYP
jgi:hypothetical protein